MEFPGALPATFQHYVSAAGYLHSYYDLSNADPAFYYIKHIDNARLTSLFSIKQKKPPKIN